MEAPATTFTAARDALATVQRTHAAHASALGALERAFDAEMALLADNRQALHDDRAAMMRQVDEKLARGEAKLEEKRAAVERERAEWDDEKARMRAAAPPRDERIKLNVGGTRFEISRADPGRPAGVAAESMGCFAAEDAPPRDSANSTSATKMGQKRLKTEASQKRNILVLGMVDVTDLQVAKLRRVEPAWRDYHRLRMLENKGYRVFTCSMGNTDLETRPSHYCHQFSSRGGKNFFEELNAEDVLIDEIVLDYYRFPAVYMLEAYKHIPGFLSSVAARCAPEATVIVPVLRRPDGGKQRAFLYWPAAEPEELSAQDVPLAAWSSHLDTDECLGGIPNAEQLALLREDTPFDRLRLPSLAAWLACLRETVSEAEARNAEISEMHMKA